MGSVEGAITGSKDTLDLSGQAPNRRNLELRPQRARTEDTKLEKSLIQKATTRTRPAEPRRQEPVMFTGG
jgi:hypothetical protein